MQTSQVSNPANVLSAPAPASKQSDSNASAEPFGQVLSREVADRRNTGEAAKPQANEQSKAAPQQARNDAKPAEMKPAKESKPTKESKSGDAADAAEASDDASNVASQAPEDLLALVANLAQLNAGAADATGASQDASTVTDATNALTASVSTKTDAPIVQPAPVAVQDLSAQPRAASVLEAVSERAGMQTKAVSALDAAMDRVGAARQQRDPAIADKSELPAATSDLIAKGQELLNGTSTGSGSSRPNDFAAAVKESMSAAAVAMQPASQAVFHAVQAASNASEKLTPSVGTPAWDQALGQKVVWMVAGGQQSATLTLNPPDLGPLQVVLNVSNSQANATFIAAQPEVRQALEAAMPKLRDMLGEAGIQLGQASVNSGTPGQQGGFDQQASQSPRSDHGTNGRPDVPGAEAPVRVSRVQPAASGLGLVDTFV